MQRYLQRQVFYLPTFKREKSMTWENDLMRQINEENFSLFSEKVLMNHCDLKEMQNFLRKRGWRVYSGDVWVSGEGIQKRIFHWSKALAHELKVTD